MASDAPAPNDAAWLDAVYRAELAYVWTSLRRLGVPDRDLADQTHDVFSAVHERRADFDASRPIRPWLFGFAFRIASRYRRKAGHARELLCDPPEPVDEGDPETSLEAARARSLVLRALEDIPLDRRAVFVMHELDEVAVPEIARVLGLGLNTAYSQLRLARRDFARALERRRGLAPRAELAPGAEPKPRAEPALSRSTGGRT